MSENDYRRHIAELEELIDALERKNNKRLDRIGELESEIREKELLIESLTRQIEEMMGKK